ncbi:MAG: hypothetical protein M1813_005663 [Trichoglossum hirsutum]|nr:MAG: hypothetical protein M1813_005663 [Trichoglossum hirsutum]
MEQSFMFILTEEDFLAAVKKLEDGGFHRKPWSYATVDPELLGTNLVTLKIHRREIREYERFDQHSVRFHFPSSFNISEKVVLLQSCYVHLSPPSAAQISTAPHLPTQRFFVNGNLYYPSKVVLLESFIRVILEEKAAGVYNWSGLPSAWAISYVCGMLSVGVDALDTCEDERVRDWYNKNIRRDQGGLNRAINKRTGRMEQRGAVPGIAILAHEL